jgi:hypothetical protein
MFGREEYIRHDDQAASGLPPKGDDGRFDLYVVMNGRGEIEVLVATRTRGPPG